MKYSSLDFKKQSVINQINQSNLTNDGFIQIDKIKHKKYQTVGTFLKITINGRQKHTPM
jgi:hypothetical protein